MNRPLIFIESPYAGDRVANRRYLIECIKDCIGRGENPYASHLMLTEALDDDKAEERLMGIALGNEVRNKCDKTVFYMDLGMSKGMNEGLKYCQDNFLDYEVRIIR